MKQIFNIFIFFNLIIFPTIIHARCAICYTQGMSGASIAVIVIVLSAIVLFIANKFLQRFLEKYN